MTIRCKTNGLVFPVPELALTVNGFGLPVGLFTDNTLFATDILIINSPTSCVSPIALATNVSGNSIEFSANTNSPGSTNVTLNLTK